MVQCSPRGGVFQRISTTLHRSRGIIAEFRLLEPTNHSTILIDNANMTIISQPFHPKSHPHLQERLFFSAACAFFVFRSSSNWRCKLLLYSGVFLYTALGRAVQPWPSSMYSHHRGSSLSILDPKHMMFCEVSLSGLFEIQYESLAVSERLYSKSRLAHSSSLFYC